MLTYSTEGMETVNRMHWGASGTYRTSEYWEHVDRIIRMADDLGLYMALLPSWVSLLKTGVITEDNLLDYGKFLADRYKNHSNIIWVLGGDIKADDYKDTYRKLGRYLKSTVPDKLITFHPFGRCSSTENLMIPCFFPDRKKNTSALQYSQANHSL